jgi:hypothetical protein
MSMCLLLLRYFDSMRRSELVGLKLLLIITGLISVLLNLQGNLRTSAFFIAEKGWFPGQLVLNYS